MLILHWNVKKRDYEAPIPFKTDGMTWRPNKPVDELIC